MNTLRADVVQDESSVPVAGFDDQGRSIPP